MFLYICKLFCLTHSMVCSNKQNNGQRVKYNNQKNNNHPHSCVKLIISCASSAIDCLSNVS